jgi:quinol monooxygenase YgiN
MEKKVLTVHARITAKTGKEGEVRKELMALVDPSRKDDGCISYDLHQATENKCVFIFYENWQSKEHLDKHLQTDHLKAFIAKADNLLAEPIEIVLMEKLS